MHTAIRPNAEPGDSLFFDAGATHGPLELRTLPAVYLSIIVTPPE